MTTTQTPNTETMSLSRIIAALENAYAAVRANHPELPPTMAIVTGTGLTARGLKWGHHMADAWKPAAEVETRRVAGSRVQVRIERKEGRWTEMFISGERLAEGATLTFQTLLHESTHALGYATDTPHMGANGRHLKAFVELAEIMGLEYTHETADPQLGYSAVTLRQDTKEKYADVIAAIGAEIKLYLDTLKRFGIQLGGSPMRGTDGTTQVIRAPRVDKRDHNNTKMTCGCGHIIRASRKVIEAASIRCEDCGELFAEPR